MGFTATAFLATNFSAPRGLRVRDAGRLSAGTYAWLGGKRSEEVACLDLPFRETAGPACPSGHNPRIRYYMRLRLVLASKFGAGFGSCGGAHVWMSRSPPWQEDFKSFPHLSWGPLPQHMALRAAFGFRPVPCVPLGVCLVAGTGESIDAQTRVMEAGLQRLQTECDNSPDITGTPTPAPSSCRAMPCRARRDGCSSRRVVCGH